jgi:hypothetical protein
MTLNEFKQYYCKGYTSGILHQHYAGQLPIARYVFDTHNIPESGFTPTFRYI